VVNGYRECYAADAKNSIYNELPTRLEVSPETLQSLVDGEITYANVVSMYWHVSGEHVCESVKNNWPLLSDLSTVYQEMEALKIWNTPKSQYIDKTEFLENYQRGKFDAGTLLTLTAVRDLSRVAREQGITLDNGGKGDLTLLADDHEERDHRWAAFSDSSSGGSEGGSDSWSCGDCIISCLHIMQPKSDYKVLTMILFGQL
jgi:hypothetical protein